MPSNAELTVHYRRLPKKTGVEYGYSGRISVRGDEAGDNIPFIGWSYKEIVYKLSELSNAWSVTKILLQRTERDDIAPSEIGERLRELIKLNPEQALHALTYEPAPLPEESRKKLEVIEGTVEGFGETVYLRMSNGSIEDPETGSWLSLAYGPKSGWKIRREDNDSSRWISIAIVDTAPEGALVAERLAFARWAGVLVEDLLAQKLDKYYLPRSWNKPGPWITHEQLEEKLRSFREQEKKACR